MKLGLVVAIACALVPAASSAQGLLLRVNAAPSAAQLADAMAIGEMQPLDKLSPPRREVFLRLYSVEREGGCVEETESVCSHQYYLAVTEYGELPGAKVYALGEVGEIPRVEWKANNSGDRTARLRFYVVKYPTSALKENPKLTPVSPEVPSTAFATCSALVSPAGSSDRPPRCPP